MTKIIAALFPLCVFIFIGCSAQQPVEPVQIDKLDEEQKNTINKEPLADFQNQPLI